MSSESRGRGCGMSDDPFFSAIFNFGVAGRRRFSSRLSRERFKPEGFKTSPRAGRGAWGFQK